MSVNFTPSLGNYHDHQPFRFWCQKVLPLVYDDSLSYYEVLCKITSYLNNIINDQKLMVNEIEEIKITVNQLQEWINNFDTSFVEDLVQEYISKVIKNVYFGISTQGYFMAVIPKSWDEITFDTIQEGDLYGHLTLSYN